MNDIYWITTIGNLSDAFIAVVIIATIVSVFAGIVMVANIDQDFEDERKAFYLALKVAKGSIMAISIAMIGIIFVPSEKQMYAIYGIGGTIDYIKSNDKAKQLPDKAVNALDAWLEQQTEEDKENGKQD